ncbi:hypothetical protein GIB67_038144 [Kingdonia uniflora]|uniref:Exonuclease domain-containing protein n=1 Tax=Kingdonia uniflora TaxID=39325 RepID=A0A7J7M1R4_9MAGN|nr:hypothetical protein GIB67_038144 [Kingdonia uniflora]
MVLLVIYQIYHEISSHCDTNYDIIYKPVTVSNSNNVSLSLDLSKLEAMNELANAFSVLELDVEDDEAQLNQNATLTKSDKGKKKGSKSKGTIVVQNSFIADMGKKKGSKSKETIVVQNDKQCQESQQLSSEYKMPLVWIDLEMTGLDIEVDRILEIACIITDGNLAKSVEGPDLVIHQTKECLDNMGEWCKDHHAASGLTKKVLDSTLSEAQAEKQVKEFVKKHIDAGAHAPLLAGNSVYVDFQFLKKYMPDLASLFSHVVVDVSSVKALCIRWYPKENRRAPSKEKKHRAMDDIRESIMELKYFKNNIFKSKSKN